MRVWRPQPDKTLDFGLDFGGGYPEYLSGLTFAGLQYGLGHIIPVADPLLRLWEGVIRFAALSNKRPVSRKSEALVLAFSGYGISCQRGLNGFEGLPVNDGFVLPGMDPAAVKDLSHVTAVSQQVDQSALTVSAPSPLLAIRQGLESGPDSEPVHFLKQTSDRTTRYLPNIHRTCSASSGTMTSFLSRLI